MKFLLFNMIRKLPWIFIGFLPIYLITYVTKEPFPFLVQRLLFFRQGGTYLLSFLPLYHLFFFVHGRRRDHRDPKAINDRMDYSKW